jgi:hypothetical protein
MLKPEIKSVVFSLLNEVCYKKRVAIIIISKKIESFDGFK